MQELVFIGVPILTFLLGVVVGAGGVVWYYKRKMQQLMGDPLDQLGEVLDE